MKNVIIRGRVGLAVVVAAAVALVAAAAPAAAAGGETTRVSVDSAGVEANWLSDRPAVSADGRFVSFTSRATNLVAGDTNGRADVFVHDQQSGATTRVSVDSSRAQGNGDSWEPAISADGRFVAFASDASNLVAGDTNNYRDVFVHDRQSGATTRVSVAASGTQGNWHSRQPAISADGRFVAFASGAWNLVAGDTNRVFDVFVHDRQSGATTRVSVDSSGAQGYTDSWQPAISADGRLVAYYSEAWNLVAGDTNWTWDVFVHDRQSGATTRVSVDSAGNQANGQSFEPVLSADGRFVAFTSAASNLVAGDTNGWADVFVHDRQSGATTRVSVDGSGTQGNGDSWRPAVSADGRFVAFASAAWNLVAGDTNDRTDIFVHDRQSGAMTLVSVDSFGNQGNYHSFEPAISADGRFVAFASYAWNLVAGDTNSESDVFVHDAAAAASDTTPPVLTVPGAVTADATSPAGTAVVYSVSAVDDADPAPSVSCSPASGSTFPIGTTTVDCTATDAADNSAAASFTVTVKGATEQINDAVADVKELNAKEGIANSLDAKLQNILDALSSAKSGNLAGACNKLDSFINEVEAQLGKSITDADAERLLAAARQIKAVVGCA